MDTNPSASWTAGLAAEAAGAGTGGPEEPLDDMISIFTTLGMKITQSDGMIHARNLTSLDNFD